MILNKKKRLLRKQAEEFKTVVQWLMNEIVSMDEMLRQIVFNRNLKSETNKHVVRKVQDIIRACEVYLGNPFTKMMVIQRMVQIKEDLIDDMDTILTGTQALQHTAAEIDVLKSCHSSLIGDAKVGLDLIEKANAANQSMSFTIREIVHAEIDIQAQLHVLRWILSADLIPIMMGVDIVERYRQENKEVDRQRRRGYTVLSFQAFEPPQKSTKKEEDVHAAPQRK